MKGLGEKEKQIKEIKIINSLSLSEESRDRFAWNVASWLRGNVAAFVKQIANYIHSK